MVTSENVDQDWSNLCCNKWSDPAQSQKRRFQWIAGLLFQQVAGNFEAFTICHPSKISGSSNDIVQISSSGWVSEQASHQIFPSNLIIFSCSSQVWEGTRSIKYYHQLYLFIKASATNIHQISIKYPSNIHQISIKFDHHFASATGLKRSPASASVISPRIFAMGNMAWGRFRDCRGDTGLWWFPVVFEVLNPIINL